jgi:hypothetical protein
MTSPYNYDKESWLESWFNQVVNLHDEEKNVETFLTPILGFASTVEEVDPVDFLVSKMVFVGSQRSDLNTRIDNAFEKRLRQRKNGAGSAVTIEYFRKLMLLHHDIYAVYENDSSTAPLTDSVKPLWKYVLRQLGKQKPKSKRVRLTSLSSCFAWAARMLGSQNAGANNVPNFINARTLKIKERALAAKKSASTSGNRKRGADAAPDASTAGGTKRVRRREQAAAASSEPGDASPDGGRSTDGRCYGPRVSSGDVDNDAGLQNDPTPSTDTPIEDLLPTNEPFRHIGRREHAFSPSGASEWSPMDRITSPDGPRAVWSPTTERIRTARRCEQDEVPPSDRIDTQDGALPDFSPSQGSEMADVNSSSLQRQPYTHSYHQWSQGGDPVCVRTGESRNPHHSPPNQCQDEDESEFPTSFAIHPIGTGTPEDATPPNLCTTNADGSGASLSYVQVWCGKEQSCCQRPPTQGVSELPEPAEQTGSPPRSLASPAGQRHPTGSFCCAVTATSIRPTLPEEGVAASASSTSTTTADANSSPSSSFSRAKDALKRCFVVVLDTAEAMPDARRVLLLLGCMSGDLLEALSCFIDSKDLVEGRRIISSCLCHLQELRSVCQSGVLPTSVGSPMILELERIESNLSMGVDCFESAKSLATGTSSRDAGKESELETES